MWKDWKVIWNLDILIFLHKLRNFRGVSHLCPINHEATVTFDHLDEWKHWSWLQKGNDLDVQSITSLKLSMQSPYGSYGRTEMWFCIVISLSISKLFGSKSKLWRINITEGKRGMNTNLLLNTATTYTHSAMMVFSLLNHLMLIQVMSSKNWCSRVQHPQSHWCGTKRLLGYDETSKNRCYKACAFI